MKQTKRRTLDSLLREMIDDAMSSTQYDRGSMYKNAVREKERQESLYEEDDDAFDEEESDTSSKTIDDEMTKLASGEVTTEDVVEKLNSIRAGRSFRDEVIASKLEEYVESLSKAEKTALLAYLKGLSQIVTGEIEPDDAMEPSDDPGNIAMKKKKKEEETARKLTIKPTVFKKPAKDEEEKRKKTPAEDTSGPVPIKPKK